eukprot:61090-Rhodomonas_salina.1
MTPDRSTLDGDVDSIIIEKTETTSEAKREDHGKRTAGWKCAGAAILCSAPSPGLRRGSAAQRCVHVAPEADRTLSGAATQSAA